jgi:hypothetical protein
MLLYQPRRSVLQRAAAFILAFSHHCGKPSQDTWGIQSIQNTQQSPNKAPAMLCHNAADMNPQPNRSLHEKYAPLQTLTIRKKKFCQSYHIKNLLLKRKNKHAYRAANV